MSAMSRTLSACSKSSSRAHAHDARGRAPVRLGRGDLDVLGLRHVAHSRSPASSSSTPSRSPPRPIRSGRSSAAGGRLERQQPGREQPHALLVEVVARATSAAGAPASTRQRAVERLVVEHRRRRAGAARPRCRPRRPRRATGGGAIGDAAAYARAAGAARRAVGGSRAQEAVGQHAGAERQRRRPLDAARDASRPRSPSSRRRRRPRRRAPAAARPSVRVAPRNASRASSLAVQHVHVDPAALAHRRGRTRRGWRRAG